MEVDRAHTGLGGEVGHAVADADEALLVELLLRLGENVIRPYIFELERPTHFVDVRQQGLVFVVEQLHGTLLDRAGEHEDAVRRRVSGRSKRNELFSRKSCSAVVWARCRT